MPKPEQEILDQKISELPFTADFKIVSKKLGFVTIGDIAAKHVGELDDTESFTQHMMFEFVQFMQENKLAHLIKQH